MLAFATNRVHGLGLTPDEFWHQTPREFDAHARLTERGDRRLASILAAVHNGPMTRADKQIWTGEMFMPDYKPPAPEPEVQRARAQLDFEMLRARFHTPTPEEQAMQRQIAHRMQRARKASADGRSAQEVLQIMKGLL